MRCSLWIGWVAALAAWWPATAAGAKLKVPGQYATIAAAAQAAAPDDTIEVAAGTYVESIDLLGAGSLRIVGKGKVVLEAAPGKSNARFQNCSAVTLKNLRFAGSQTTGILLDTCWFMVVENCVVEGALADGILLDDALFSTIRNNRVATCQKAGIKIYGGGSNEVTGNTISACGEEGVFLQGTGNTVDRNRIDDAGRRGCYFTYVPYAHKNLVMENRIRRPNWDGIAVSAHVWGCVILGNRVDGGARAGIDLGSNMETILVHSNVIKNSSEHGITGTGDLAVLVGNRISRCRQSGIALEGLHHALEGNRVSRSGWHGLWFSADESQVSFNVLKKSGAGYYDLYQDPTGSLNTFFGNKAGTDNL